MLFPLTIQVRRIRYKAGKFASNANTVEKKEGIIRPLRLPMNRNLQLIQSGDHLP